MGEGVSVARWGERDWHLARGDAAIDGGDRRERQRRGSLKMAQIIAAGDAPLELRSVPSFLPPLRSHSDGGMRHSIPVRRPRPRPFSFFLGFLRILPPSPIGPLTPEGGGTSAPSPIVVTSEALTGFTYRHSQASVRLSELPSLFLTT